MGYARHDPSLSTSSMVANNFRASGGLGPARHGDPARPAHTYMSYILQNPDTVTVILCGAGAVQYGCGAGPTATWTCLTYPHGTLTLVGQCFVHGHCSLIRYLGSDLPMSWTRHSLDQTGMPQPLSSQTGRRINPPVIRQSGSDLVPRCHLTLPDRPWLVR